MFHQSRQTVKHTIALNLRRLKYGVPREKVFCVGFQKTGTTSLQYGLSLLGYRVGGVMDANPHDTPQSLYSEALSLVPQFDAFADNPWPLYFREFDAMLPGAKFILTCRDPDLWYTSICKHFGDKNAKMRGWIYGEGSPEGNKKAYVERLIDHQERVRMHFSGRPRDFLEFDVARGDGWEKLCAFLGKRQPVGDFPRLNTAAMRK